MVRRINKKENKMKYTEEQVKRARTNNNQLRGCPWWMQRMFEECPDRLLLGRSSNQVWSTYWEGNSPDIAYQIPHNWTPDIVDGKLEPSPLTKILVNVGDQPDVDFKVRYALWVSPGGEVAYVKDQDMFDEPNHDGCMICVYTTSDWKEIDETEEDRTVTLADGTKVVLSEESYKSIKEAM